MGSAHFYYTLINPLLYSTLLFDLMIFMILFWDIIYCVYCARIQSNIIITNFTNFLSEIHTLIFEVFERIGKLISIYYQKK